MTKQAELLKRLTIEETERGQQETSSKIAFVFTALGFFALGVVIGHYFISPWRAETPLLDSGFGPNDSTPANLGADQSTEQALKGGDVSERINQYPSDEVLNGSGFITARRIATVSATIMGLITEVKIEEGMAVSEGQVLARLDDRLARANVSVSEAHIKTLESRLQSNLASLQEAQSNHKRVINNQFASAAERTQVIAELARQQAAKASAEAEIDRARLDLLRQQELLADHTIRAPFAGIVTVKAAQAGEIVAPSSAGGGLTRTGICTIVDMDSLEVEVDVNEAYIGQVISGQPVRVNLDAYPDWDVPARVIAIIPTADRGKATVKVRIGLIDKDKRILPDMGVKVAFLEPAN